MKSYSIIIKPQNILYIHGLGSGADSSTYKYLKEILKNHNIMTSTFDLLDPTNTLNKINQIIRTNHITRVIGSSLGGFYTLCCDDSVGKIVINPCLDPVKEVPKLTDNVAEEILDQFNQMKIKMVRNIDGEVRMFTYGIFGTNDELFSYVKEFNKLYGYNNNILQIPAKHRPTKEQLERSIPKGLNYLISSTEKLDNINEHFVNIFVDKDQQNLNRYKDEVYELLQKSYAPIGGLLGIANVDELINDTSFWKLCTKGNKVVAACLYTNKRGGRKMIACGTDGSSVGKTWLYKILSEDIKFQDRNSWAEISDAMEHIYLNKLGAVPVPVDITEKVMFDKRFIKKHSDGYHYDRMIGGEVHTKILVGYPETKKEL